MLANLDYPAEILVNDDGSTDGSTDYILQKLKERKISWSVFNGGGNMGVGAALRNCVAVSHGYYIVKADQDLEYKPKWLSTAIAVLDRHSDVGCVSLFDYKHVSPTETRFNVTQTREDCYIVDDLVSSIYAFRRSDLVKIVPIQDDGNHQHLPLMAITKEDFVNNFGFGEATSTYVSRINGDLVKTPTNSLPLII